MTLMRVISVPAVFFTSFRKQSAVYPLLAVQQKARQYCSLCALSSLVRVALTVSDV